MNPALYEALSTGLTRPREIASQTARQLDENPRYAALDQDALFADPDAYLQDYEIETVFGPLVAVTLEDRAHISPLLAESPLDETGRAGLLRDLTQAGLMKPILLPDGTQRSLSVTEPLVDRYMRLLRVDIPIQQDVCEMLYEGLPGHLAAVAHALCRERHLNAQRRQRVFARITTFAAAGRLLAVDDIETIADFVAAQEELAAEPILDGIDEAVRLADEALRKAKMGRTYLTQSVAEHHQMHGVGDVDEAVVSQRERALARLRLLQLDLRAWVDEGCP